MKIKYFSEFIAEALGIDKDIELQAQNIYREIKDSNKSEFDFILYETSGNYFFKLIIGDTGDAEGLFTMEDNGKLYITLKNRNDYATLLHEMKHMSRAVKNKGAHFNHFIYKSKKKLDRTEDKTLSIPKKIFYVYDIDEFESKYHGYYVDIDEYIQKEIERSKRLFPDKKIDKNFIVNTIKDCLNENNDLTYTWWVGYFNGKKVSKEFNFSNYLKESEINKLFYLINKKEFNPKYSFVDMFKEIFLDFKKIIKTKLNLYSKKEKISIQKSRKIFEVEINRRKNIFSKKFYRLFTIMIDKYANC